MILDNLYTTFGSVIATAIVMFFGILALLWLLLPLILYQIKQRLERLIAEAIAIKIALKQK